MDRDDIINLGMYFAILVMIVFWIRYNLEYMETILMSSTLFFQLMVSVLIIAVMRNVFGVKTFGVFGPTIIVFGILKVGLFLGLTIYLNLFLIAMLLSLVFYPLRISSSYRVAIIISTIVIMITMFELVGELFHLSVFEGAIFFPVLIISWLADRFVVQVKEIDWIETSKKFIGTLFAIIIVYFVIGIDMLISFISVNPETWLLFIGTNFYLAKKSDFRWTDSNRFKGLIRKLNGKKDILSLNVRNRDYIAKYNPISMFSNLTKDKMKISFHQLGIPTPQTFMIVENSNDLKKFEKVIKDKNSFVIKPTKGLGGEGILVVDAKNGKFYVSGEFMSLASLENHIKQILEGQFSNDNEDKAIIEEKIIVDQKFSKLFYKGVFDIRVIVFYGFPVMSMMRIPTKESKGLANIHKGAISMGLDISDGHGINPFWKGRGGHIKNHPDTGVDLQSIKIPNWSEVLKIACLAQGASKLNYVGVDVTLSDKGPMILEVNKRPGIEIQNANLEGLLKRLKFIERRLDKIKFKDVDERIKLSKEYNRRNWK